MIKSFDASATTDDVLAGVDLRGKRILVTGVSAGLGIETARSLASHGAEVVGTARDLAKAEAAIAPARGDAANGGSIELVQLDLADLASVRACADALTADGGQLDVIIANAGVMTTPFGHTVDGFETQFGTNHLGHFVLINRLVPLVKDGGRIVIVASFGHRFSDVDLEDPNFEKTEYEPWGAYGRSKTANILYAVELDRRLKDRGIRVTALHPGDIRTELGRHVGLDALDVLVESINADMAAKGKPLHHWKTISQGAATSVWAGVVAPGDMVGGRYCQNSHVVDVDDSEISPVEEGVRSYALDPERAKTLWAKSEAMVGERF